MNYMISIHFSNPILLSCPTRNCGYKGDSLKSLKMHILSIVNQDGDQIISDEDRDKHVNMLITRLKNIVFLKSEDPKKYVFDDSVKVQFVDYCKLLTVLSENNICLEINFSYTKYLNFFKCPWCKFENPLFQPVLNHILSNANKPRDDTDLTKYHLEMVSRCKAFILKDNAFYIDKKMQSIFFKILSRMSR